MRETPDKKWVILIQKVPRGPFSEIEVKNLLSDGVIRSSDVGFQTDPDNPKASSSWKMLWQFSEFDRRTGQAASAAPASPAERRNVMPEETAKKKVMEAVPSDLLDIPPEELVPKSIAQIPVASTRNNRDESLSLEPTIEEVTAEDPSRRWVYGGAVLLITVLGLFKLVFLREHSNESDTPKPGFESFEKLAPAEVTELPSPKKIRQEIVSTPPAPIGKPPISSTHPETGSVPREAASQGGEEPTAREKDRDPDRRYVDEGRDEMDETDEDADRDRKTEKRVKRLKAKKREVGSGDDGEESVESEPRDAETNRSEDAEEEPR